MKPMDWLKIALLLILVAGFALQSKLPLNGQPAPADPAIQTQSIARWLTMATGKQQQITITASSGLSKGEVDRMVKEAEAHASEDARRRQEVEVRNQADSLVYSTERALAEHGAKLSDAERSAVERALADAREALKGGDVERGDTFSVDKP